MPPKNKKQHASPHDKRHENGLAPPGKRVLKSRSNGNLNGHANGAALVGTSNQYLETTSETDQLYSPGYDSHLNGAAKVPELIADGSRYAFDGTALDSAQFRAVSGEVTPPQFYSEDPSSGAKILDRTGQRTPVYGAAQPATIIELHPFRDVIAILLLLLFLPPWAVTLVHVGYATLTFSPPSSGWSLSSLTSSHEWLHSSGGNPSLVTTVLSDFAALMLWLMIPLAQDLVLDLALGVIAISLGGGVSSRTGSTSSVLLCSSIIGCCRLLRYKSPRQHGANVLWILLSRTPFRSLATSEPPIVSDYKHAARGWPRTLLELHILAQGVVKIVRRQLSEPRGRGNDIDSISTSISNPSTNNDTATEGARNTSTDGRPPGPPPTIRETKDKLHSGRKRKKLATQVRSQQPFWAALASTKITFSKDKEAKSASVDSSEAGATDVHHLGDGSLNATDSHVWIQEIDATEVNAVAMLPKYLTRMSSLEAHCINSQGNTSDEEDEDDDDDDDDDDETLDPVTVLVNGAVWNSILISHVPQEESSLHITWLVRIFGLTESTNYLIQFFRASDDFLLHSANVITRVASSGEQPSSNSLGAPQSLRPSSPTTTLRKSILAAEATLSEQRHRAKAKKKDYRHATANLKKDVDIMLNRLSTSGGNDEKQRQRQLQFQQQIRQAEDSLSEMTSEFENLGDIPKDEMDAAAESKAKWREEHDRLKAAERELNQSRSEADHRIASANAEKNTALQKRERLAARLAKLTQQHNHSLVIHTDRVKRDQDRASLTVQNREIEQRFSESIGTFQARLEEINQSNFAAQQQITFLQNIHGPHSMSSIPESPDFPITPNSSHSPLTGHPGYQSSHAGTHLADFGRSRAGSARGTRERPSSMLSNVSGLTDDATNQSISTFVPSNQFNAPQLFTGSALTSSPIENDGERKGSDGSGGSGNWRRPGSGSGNSSQRDPNSPAPRLSPIGTGIGRGSPR